MHDERPIEIRLRAARARRRRLHAQARAFASRDALRELLQLAADIAALEDELARQKRVEVVILPSPGPA